MLNDPASVMSFDRLPFYFGLLFVIGAITHVFRLLYFHGLFGQASRQGSVPLWGDEASSWLQNVLAAIAGLLYGVVSIPLALGGIIVWLIATALVVGLLWFNLIKLMFHDLPPWLAWLILFLAFILAILSGLPMFLFGIGSIASGGGAPIGILMIIFGILLTLALAAIYALILTLLVKLTRALTRNSWLGTLWRKYVDGEPQKPTGGGSSTIADPGVTNPDGVLPDPSGTVGGGTPSILPPDSCITVDFGSRSIEDHLGVPDLRAIYSPADAAVTVEVSNDGSTWQSCSRDRSTAAAGGDFDVPYWSSPWRYVRICNLDQRTINVYDVLDLSN